MNTGRRNFLKSSVVLLTASGMAPDALGQTCNDDASLLNIGLQKQLFFDNLLVESVQDITREFHQPRKYEGNPLIVKDKPWEHVVQFRTSTYRVLQDPKDKLFKCWYTDEGFTNENLRRSVTFPLYRNLYAYSEDGIDWIKPQLGMFREDGQDTNIFWGDQRSGGADSRYVIIDPFESDESKRFKTIYFQAFEGDLKSHIEVGYSADGLHWKKYDQSPSFGKFGPHLGDVTILSYDLEKKVYVLNTRHSRMHDAALNPRFPKTQSFFDPFYPRDFARMNKRRIFRCESSDFVHWGEPALLLTPDEQDNLDDSLYGMVQHQIGDTQVGLLDVLHQVADVMDVQ